MTPYERWIGILVVATTTQACGSSSSDAPDGSPSTLDATSNADSDASIRPSALGAVSLNLTASGASGSSCPSGPHWVNVPFNTARAQNVGATTQGSVAIDGEAHMSVACTVHDNGTSFDVEGTLRSPAIDVTGQMLAATAVTLRTTLSVDQAEAMGSITLQDDLTSAEYSDTACSFSVHPRQPGEQLGIEASRVWASVTCPAVRDPTNPDMSAVCQIVAGWFVLENCER